MPEERTTSSTGGQKGVKLQRFDLIPVGPLTELAEHYGIGASKYANHQWRKGYEWSKSYAALMRHLTAFWAGFDHDVCSNDPEGCSHVDADGNPFTAVREDACFNHTGSHHMAAVAWHAFCLLEFKDTQPSHDDRHKPESSSPWALTPEAIKDLKESINGGTVTFNIGGDLSEVTRKYDITREIDMTWDGPRSAYGPDLLSKRAQQESINNRD